MELLHFQAANCKNCYRCIRTCPVKAIEFRDNQARIIADDCIFCCTCLRECPQNAKTVESDLYKVARMLQTDAKITVSLAPSFAGYAQDPDAFIRRLYELGFAEVRETAEAAAVVSKQYEEMFRAKGRLVTTACPVVVEYMEKYFPEWLDVLAETDSPMMAHAKWIKQQNPDAKVVFIGPCYAKKTEAARDRGYVDAVLTFEEVRDLNVGSGLHLFPRMGEKLAREEEEAEPAAPCRKEEPREADCESDLASARLYPVEGGVVETTFGKGVEPASSRRIAVSGIENCQRLFSSLKELPQGYFLELNACEGGCVNGPASGDRLHPIVKQNRILAYRGRPREPRSKELAMEPTSLIRREFRDRKKPPHHYTSSQINGVLSKIGKNKKEDELNCGACGYNSCRDKAVAVLAGRAELYMCMPYAQAKAESFAHVLLEETPNAVLAVTDQLLVKEVNDAAGSFYKMDASQLIGLPVAFLLDPEEIALSPLEPVRKKLYFPELHKTASVSVSYVADHQLYLIILHDITEQEEEQEKLRSLKHDTVEMAQRVIENQMRVAQEIAGLLGETTAETKVTLTKMKRLLLEE